MKKTLLILTTAFVSLISFSQVPNYVPTNGLVGYWPFNGNANDESGNGNNGTVNGATLTTDRFGVANKAYSFDGVNDVVTVPDNISLDFPNGVLSICVSVKMDLLSGDIAFIDHLDNGSPSIYARYSIRKLNDNKLRFLVKDMSSNFSWVDSDISIGNTSDWYHIVGTFDFSSQTIKIYINGQNHSGIPVLQGTGADITPPGILQFGKYGDVNFTNARIDDIGIWNRALTQCEIQDLYNAQLNSVAVNAGTDQTLCEGQSTSLFGSGASTYTWNNNVQNGVGFVPTATSSYTVTGTDANGCIGTDTVNIVVNNNSSSTLNETALDSYTLNGQTYTQSGTYTQTLTNAAGCDSTITLNLTLNFTGLNELENTILIAPNPATDQLTISCSSSLNENYILFDPQGRSVLSGKLSGTATQLDLSKLARGNYLLQIGEKTTPVKLVKE